MGEWIPASIKFGGKLKREHVAPLITLCRSFNLNTEMSDSRDIEIRESDLFLTLSNSSINYGNLDDIINFCASIALDYEHWFDSGPGWSPGIKRRVGDRFEECICSESDAPMLSMASLRTTMNLVSGLAIILDTAKWWCTPLPPLEIVP